MTIEYILGHLIALIIAIEYENWRLSKKRFHKRPDGDIDIV